MGDFIAFWAPLLPTIIWAIVGGRVRNLIRGIGAGYRGPPIPNTDISSIDIDRL